MRATAQFAAGADVEHAHFVTVLFTEEHHGAELLRFFNGQHTRLRGGIGQDLGVDQCFNLRDLGVGDRCVVCKVKTRALGIH